MLLRETITSGSTTRTLDFRYDNIGYPYALIYNNGSSTATYYYITNLQGDVMYLVDSNGNQVAAYTYDPYGKILSATGAMAEINPLRYRGYYYDAETGFYYLQSRYYDPNTCRFINADSYASTGQGLIGYNMFAYCNNDPVDCMDEKGFAARNMFTTMVNDGGGSRRTAQVKQVKVEIASEAGSNDRGILYIALMSSNIVGKLGTHNELRKIAAGTGLEVHHLIEKRFLVYDNIIYKIFSNTNAMPSVILTTQEHQAFTAWWRIEYPYGKTDYYNILYQLLSNSCERIYTGRGEWIDYIASFFR